MGKWMNLGQVWIDRITRLKTPEVSVIGAAVSPMPLTEAEWLKRYMQRMIAVARLTDAQALAAARAESFAVLSDGYEDDPEGAADMGMSYWSD